MRGAAEDVRVDAAVELAPCWMLRFAAVRVEHSRRGWPLPQVDVPEP
jgi:hypothetical protein